MAGLSVQVKGLDSLLKDLSKFPKAMAKAERNAVNTTATATNKKSYVIAGNIYNIKVSRLKKAPGGQKGSFVKRAGLKKTTAEIIYGWSVRPNLGHYAKRGTKNVKKGVRFKIKKFDPTKRLPRGFYAPLKGGQSLVVQRKEGTFTGKRGKPILIRRIGKVATGPNMKQIMEEEGFVMPATLAFSAKELERKTIKAVDDQLRNLRG